MTRIRIGGVVLLVVLGAGLLTRITNRGAEPPQMRANPPAEIPAVEGQPVAETVELRNGNVHVEMPLRAAHQKPTAP